MPNKMISGLVLGLQIGLIFSGFLGGNIALAAGNSVVINEIAWAGSSDGSSDEWIELYNNSNSEVDISGWVIKDDGVSAFIFAAGAKINAYGYFLIEDSEAAVNDVQSNALFNMSLANSGDSLELLNSSGQQIDIVNASGAAWYSGSSTEYSSMERIDPLAGDLASNFASSTGSIGKGRSGSTLKATPGQRNSVANYTDNSPKVFIDDAALEGVSPGQTVAVQIKAQNLTELFSYGVDLNYDPLKMQFLRVIQGGFLSENGNVETSFQSGLLDGIQGNLLVAEARTISPQSGVTGTGELFTVEFKVLANSGDQVFLDLNQESFARDLNGDMNVVFEDATATIGVLTSQVDPVLNLTVSEGLKRYEIKLTWQAPGSGADQYLIERKNALGNFVEIGKVAAPGFLDNDSVVAAGKIIPEINYVYRVSAIKNGINSAPIEIIGSESRGLRGDNNRTDLVNGRDLERLALHFAETSVNSGFDALIDTTYDGRVDGNDLIDIGANFAKKYNQ